MTPTLRPCWLAGLVVPAASTLTDLRLGCGEQLCQKWREEGMSKGLAWSLHPPPKLLWPLGRLKSEERPRQGQVSARGRCRLDPMWVGATQVLRWECVFMFVGAKSSLRCVLSVSRALLTPCCSTPLPKILHSRIVCYRVVSRFPFVSVWRRPGETPMIL